MGKSVSNVSLVNGNAFGSALFGCKARFVKEKQNADLSTIFKVHSGFHEGHHACIFTTIDENAMLNDDIEVSVIPNVGLGSMMTEKTLVPFSSAFKLVSSSNIQLTNVDPQTEIVITGKLTKSISRNFFTKLCTFFLF